MDVRQPPQEPTIRDSHYYDPVVILAPETDEYGIVLGTIDNTTPHEVKIS